MPVTGTPSSVAPNSAALSRTSGRISRGTPKIASNSSSHSCRWMSKSMVREAFVASVAWTRPPVRRQSRKQSTVPNASSPAAARRRASGTLSSSHAILLAEKYGSTTSPVRSRIRASCPSATSLSQNPAVRRSCQTTAGWITSPVARSQITTVSRWFVMPIAARSVIAIPASASAPSIVATVSRQMSSGSCSTQPGRGKCCGSSICARPTGRPAASKTMEREEVVP